MNAYEIHLKCMVGRSVFPQEKRRAIRPSARVRPCLSRQYETRLDVELDLLGVFGLLYRFAFRMFCYIEHEFASTVQ